MHRRRRTASAQQIFSVPKFRIPEVPFRNVEKILWPREGTLIFIRIEWLFRKFTSLEGLG
jgi:hypothetical protein